VIKPNINPTSNEPLRVHFSIIKFIPKVTIYRVNKYSPGTPFIDVMLQFRNPNMSQALISFEQLTDAQIEEVLSQDKKN